MTEIKHPAGGEFYKFNFFSQKYRPGTIREVTVYVPETLSVDNDVAVEIFLDGQMDFVPEVTERLIAEQAVPPMITVGVAAAEFLATLPGGTMRSVRSQEYDGQGDGFANLLIDEILPEVAKILPDGIKISDDPDMHAMCGCSSGGICSWNICFERNDFFRRAYINSPTFSAFHGGEDVPFLMRKYEPRKIRTFMTVGTDDMKNSAGNWYLEALSAREALEYAGYEYEFEIFENGEHGVGREDPDVLERAQRFIWQNWADTPVGIRFYPPRIADIVSMDTQWEPTDLMPDNLPCRTELGWYDFKENKIILHRNCGENTVVAEMPFHIAGIALSCDRWRIYAVMPEKRFVYVWAIYPDGSLHDMYAHGHLHIKEDFSFPGGKGVCVDTGDRVYTATELGIQTHSIRGHNNTILPLPGNVPVTAVAFGTDDRNTLYAQAADGRIFKRKVNTCGIGNSSEVLIPDTPPF